ncbi:helix-turn-helix transcriptional regulator [Conexibacter stalactiti]|uniref:Helix-turn-helix transcriptional regulator n=1 Tax=Conexibacter stalactiti TaxID=1940611 RepID=A0ABU4I232_9ACTN|nr:helix-turn-helix transcriptional regulator [Conexibacter stalactiti]MDW5598354.1 helix-turn-helix transcriptional regulator [Conexibacter stalactiti]MEC5038996.1 helix-turn-helix transcriptional regulator [Conexibacter stalactiti]
MNRPATIDKLRRLHEQAVKIIEREHTNGIEIDEVAALLSTSRRQLQRAFVEFGGVTYRQHVTEVRMRHAARLLADRSLTIGAITERVGYRQQSQFSKSFRARYGILPSAYRRALASTPPTSPSPGS